VLRLALHKSPETFPSGKSIKKLDLPARKSSVIPIPRKFDSLRSR